MRLLVQFFEGPQLREKSRHDAAGAVAGSNDHRHPKKPREQRSRVPETIARKRVARGAQECNCASRSASRPDSSQAVITEHLKDISGATVLPLCGEPSSRSGNPCIAEIMKPPTACENADASKMPPRAFRRRFHT